MKMMKKIFEVRIETYITDKEDIRCALEKWHINVKGVKELPSPSEFCECERPTGEAFKNKLGFLCIKCNKEIRTIAPQPKPELPDRLDMKVFETEIYLPTLLKFLNQLRDCVEDLRRE